MRVVTLFRPCFFLFAVMPLAAFAHDPINAEEGERLPLWIGVVTLAAFYLLYLVGAFRVRPAIWRLGIFTLATILAAFTLFGPLDSWAETSAAMHMVQHMMMMVVIAPLWVIAQPLPQLLALAPRVGSRAVSPLMHLAGFPMLAATIHGAVIWFWHAPKFYVLALENPWWHVVEHACFLLSAGVFWWAVLRGGQRAAGKALLAVLFTLMHTGFLGAFLTFAAAPLYGPERSLESQQLAGLIMWVLGGIPYLLAAAWIASRWFQQILRRAQSHTAATAER